MNQVATREPYGELIEPATLRIERLLPAPIDRCWAYLTESELRRQWLASGDMPAQTGMSFELIWRNDELSDPGTRPEGFEAEHHMVSEVTDLDPPRRLSITWGRTGGVTFELEPRGRETLLTVTHRRLLDRGMLLDASSGWHAHLDILVALTSGMDPQPFWPAWQRLKEDYDRRLPA